MNTKMLHMFESIKSETYTTYTDFLEKSDIERIKQWFSSVAQENSCEGFEKIISLMYEFYIREDIDFRSDDEYTRIVSYLSEEYGFAAKDFLNLYQGFKKIFFEG